MTYLLEKKEARSGATLEEDLHILTTKKCEEVGYTGWMAIVYRCEKKKILASNIDMCHYVIRILQELIQRKEKGITLKEFHELTMLETPAQKKHLHKLWVHNPDPIFSEEDQFIRRRI